MARGQLMKRCSPPIRRMSFMPGAQIEMVGVAENDLRAERFKRCPGARPSRSLPFPPA